MGTTCQILSWSMTIYLKILFINWIVLLAIFSFSNHLCYSAQKLKERGSLWTAEVVKFRQLGKKRWWFELNVGKVSIEFFLIFLTKTTKFPKLKNIVFVATNQNLEDTLRAIISTFFPTWLIFQRCTTKNIAAPSRIVCFTTVWHEM